MVTSPAHAPGSWKHGRYTCEGCETESAIPCCTAREVWNSQCLLFAQAPMSPPSPPTRRADPTTAFFAPRIGLPNGPDHGLDGSAGRNSDIRSHALRL